LGSYWLVRRAGAAAPTFRMGRFARIASTRRGDSQGLDVTSLETNLHSKATSFAERAMAMDIGCTQPNLRAMPIART